MRMQTILKSIAFIIVAIIISSCSVSDEPGGTSAASSTRSVSSEKSMTYTLSEIRSIADAKLTKQSGQNTVVSINPVCATDSKLKPNLLSDTVAFIVNYQNNGGFVVIANDKRVDPILAWSDNGNMKDDNTYVRLLFLDNIQSYLASISQGFSDNIYSVANSPVRRFIVDPMVEIKLHPFTPFNEKIQDHYDWSFPSTPVVAATTILACAKKSLTYKGFHYDFKQINYAYKQGEGFNPLNPGVQPNGLIPGIPATFLYSYAGSVSAYNQLMYDLGEDTHTIYKELDFGDTDPADVYLALKKMNLTMTSIQSPNLQNITNLLSDGYIFHMSGELRDAHTGALHSGHFSWVVDGCEVYLNSDNSVQRGSLHCVWGFGDDENLMADGFYSFPIIYRKNDVEVRSSSCFGVKMDL